MKHGVLKNVHPEIGMCFHIPWVPGTPAPAPSPVPYTTFTVMGGTIPKLTSKMTDTTFTEYFGLTMLQGTDVGPFTAHFGPPTQTMPFDLLGSASKAYFAVSGVQADGKPIVASLLFIVDIGLNCGTPIPTPTGRPLAITTHRVDMSWADIMGGLANMACDFAIQSALGWAGGAIGGRIAARLGPAVSNRAFQNALYRGLVGGLDDAAADAAAAAAGRLAAERMERLVGYGVGFFLGGPMGADFGTDAVGGWTPGGAGANYANTGTTSGEGSGGVSGAGRAVGTYMDNAGVPSL